MKNVLTLSTVNGQAAAVEWVAGRWRPRSVAERNHRNEMRNRLPSSTPRVVSIRYATQQPSQGVLRGGPRVAEGVLRGRIFPAISLFLCAALSLASCKSMMVNAVSTGLSGANKKGIPSKPKKSDGGGVNAVMGETDTTLVAGFFPTALVAYEMMYASNKSHAGLAAMTGSLNVMYANAFVQGPAAKLGADKFDEQDAEYRRAKMHYLRGRDYCLAALDIRHKGFAAAVMSGDADKVKSAVDKLDKNDVNAAYWAAAGWLGAFSLDPLDGDLLGALASPPAMLEKAASLDKDYSAGAIWDVLSNFYISAPADFGGDAERAKVCHAEAMRSSGGKAVGPYLTYAESFCVNAGDKKGFKEALETALAIDPDADPSTRLMTVIYQERAKRLLQHIDDYFVEW